MNNPPDHRDRLLAETFHPNWDDGSPAQFARRAAAHARHRRRRRGALATGAAALALLAIASVGVRQRSSAPPARGLPATTPAYEVISDAELLAELRDRPLVVVKRANGANDFVLIGE